MNLLLQSGDHGFLEGLYVATDKDKNFGQYIKIGGYIGACMLGKLLATKDIAFSTDLAVLK